MLRRLRLLLFAAIGGALTGVVSWAFLEALDHATTARVEHPWLLWLLPVAGVVVASAYHYRGGHAKGGTPSVIEQAHTFTHGVPARMAPFIFGGAVAGHLTGASVGREGAALQIAGSVTDSAARLGRLPTDDRRTLVAASLAGGWGAVFGVPFTGIAFALQFTRHHRWRALVPAAISAFTGDRVVKGLGYHIGGRPQIPAPQWSLGLPFALLLVGVAMGLVGRTFVGLLHWIKARMAHHVSWPPVRPIVGAVATIALVGLVGRDYLGLSTPLMEQAFAGETVDLWVPLLKLLFTVVALGTGFVGGEVLPLFVMGSTLGAAIAPGLDMPTPLAATTGSVAAFTSAASVALTGIVLTVEQFGWHTLVPALIVGAAARIAAGRPGLYVAEHHSRT